MGILHVAGASAGVSLLRAIQASGRDEQVIRHFDDFSCAPIALEDPLARDAWRAQFRDEPGVGDSLASFWDRIATTDDHLVIWFGRYSAMELAFTLAWADCLGEQAYDVVDVTGLELPFSRQDGSVSLYPPAQAASRVPSIGLQSLLDRRRRNATRRVNAGAN